jgi:hypothetical protein
LSTTRTPSASQIDEDPWCAQSSLKKHKTADLFLLEICVVILSNWACKAVEAVSMLHLLHAWQGTI